MDHLGPEPPRSAFGEYLRVLRQTAALTQGDLAERAGLTIDAIAALESGRRRHPYPHSVAALATALSLSGDERRLFVRQAAHARFSQPAANAERPLSNVPTPLTTLIGRSHDAAALRGLLVGSSSRRLVTVVGVGGVGKTALAIRVAGELSSSFPDGVWLVELAPIADPVLVPKALSNVLGIADAPHILALRAIPTFLASKSVLLVLDNCEHLLEVCSELVEQVLAGCANVRVLAPVASHSSSRASSSCVSHHSERPSRTPR